MRVESDDRNGFLNLVTLWWETIVSFTHASPRQHWDMLRQDCTYGLRTMVTNPAYSILAVVTLGLGIGANTAIFSVIDAILLKPLPYTRPEQLVRLEEKLAKVSAAPLLFSALEVNDYRSQNESFSDVAEYHSMQFTLLGEKDPGRLATGVVSSNFFDLLGIKPIMGRTFVPEDEKKNGPPVLVLSYGYWVSSVKGDPNVIGKTLHLNDRVHTIVGVLPPLPEYPGRDDVYMPTTSCPFRSSPVANLSRDFRMLKVFARLKPGVSISHANADVRVIADRMALNNAKFYPAGSGYSVESYAVQEELTHAARPTFLILLAAAGLVLMLACANVANLTLSRQLRRAREMSIRIAIGAGRTRLFRQLLTESILTALVGGVLGVVLAASSLRVLVSFAARFTPRTGEIQIDTTVLLFALVASILTGLIFGSIPGLSVGRDPAKGLQEAGDRSTGTERGSRLRDSLIVSQVAISFVLLIGASLMLRSLYNLLSIDSGFKAESVVTMQMSVNWTKYSDPLKRGALHRQVLERLRAIPGVESVGMTRVVPLNGEPGVSNDEVRIEGRSMEEGQPVSKVDYQTVSVDYFRTLGVPLLSGRAFNDADSFTNPNKVCMVNQLMANHYWPGQDPIGHRVSNDSGRTWMTIVGVVQNIRQYGLDHDAVYTVYMPTDQHPLFESNLVLRSKSDPFMMARQAVAQIHEMDPEQPVTKIRTLEQIRTDFVAAPRVSAVLLGMFALLALCITIIGIVGMLSLVVVRRAREIGIRMALGASRGNILRMVVTQGLTPVLVGLGVGAVAALLLTRLISGFLFQLKPTDPLEYVATALVLLVSALLACVLPARRATRIDPMVALRDS